MHLVPFWGSKFNLVQEMGVGASHKSRLKELYLFVVWMQNADTPVKQNFLYWYTLCFCLRLWRWAAAVSALDVAAPGIGSSIVLMPALDVDVAGLGDDPRVQVSLRTAHPVKYTFYKIYMHMLYILCLTALAVSLPSISDGSIVIKLKPWITNFSSCNINLSFSLQSCFAIVVENKDTWPGSVTKLRMVCIQFCFFSFVSI